jgi:hypothetical protein
MSLSKPSLPVFDGGKKKGEGFDKLSPNGSGEAITKDPRE